MYVIEGGYNEFLLGGSVGKNILSERLEAWPRAAFWIRHSRQCRSFNNPG